MSQQLEETFLQVRLREVGEYLIDLADRQAGLDGFGANDADAGLILSKAHRFVDDTEMLRAVAQREYTDRAKRRECLPGDLFGEPAWDIMLDLFIAKTSGLKICVTSACIASQVPPTTALRWLSILEERGLVERTADNSDKRRSWVELSASGFQNMKDCLRKKAMQRATDASGFMFAASPGDGS